MDFDRPPQDPIAELDRWLADAVARSGLPNPNAMTLATVDPDGRPSARIVLLKKLDAEGAVFFTNRGSRKGIALAAHPRAALLLHWDSLERQARLEGPVAEVPDDESDAYFASRPRGSQLSAWASAQSRPVPDRRALEQELEQAARRFEGRDVPRPPHWGGYRVVPHRVELWQGRPDRLHDRVLYERDGDGAAWSVRRLAP